MQLVWGGVAGPRKGWGCGGTCGQLSARRVGPGFPGAGASSLQSGLTSHSVISFPPTLYLFVFGLWCAVPLFWAWVVFRVLHLFRVFYLYHSFRVYYLYLLSRPR